METRETLRKSPLHELHEARGAAFGESAGWLMPTSFDGVFEEHRHTRRGASVFDLSHLARIKVYGRDAEALLDRTFVGGAADLPVGRCRRGCLCNPEGGIVADAVLCRFEGHWLLVGDAGRRQALFDWLTGHAPPRVRIQDVTAETAMLSVDGPRTWTTARRLLPFELGELEPFALASELVMLMRCWAARIGLIGEEGLLLVMPTEAAGLIWSSLTEPRMGDPEDQIKPAGGEARESLRIESGRPGYGRELSGQIDPISSGLELKINFSKKFIGREAILRISQEGPARLLVGMELEGQRIARRGARVRVGEAEAGCVTSGTISPMLSKVIALGYLPAEHSDPGQEVAVEVADRWVDGQVVTLPFYRGAAAVQ